MDDFEVVIEDIWDELYVVNVKGMFFCVRVVVLFMKKSKVGVIVNVGSIVGLIGVGLFMFYVVLKLVVYGLMKLLVYVLVFEIRVSGVVLGVVVMRWWVGWEEKMKSMIGILLL